MKSQLEEQFIEMLMENKGEFYKVAYSYVKTEANALDMVGEATYNGLNSINKLHNPKFMKTWFYRILINTCKKFLKKNKNVVYRSDLVEQLSIDMIDKEELIDLYNAIQKLPEKYMEVINLKYFRQMTIDEISLILECNPNTVKTRLKRGIERLKNMVV